MSSRSNDAAGGGRQRLNAKNCPFELSHAIEKNPRGRFVERGKTDWLGRRRNRNRNGAATSPSLERSATTQSVFPERVVVGR
jgi:hypothetical protein